MKKIKKKLKQDLKSFQATNNVPQKKYQKEKCLIYVDNTYKLYFDLAISVLLIFICGVLPFRIAFFPKETDTWKNIYFFADSLFLIDLILNFFTTNYDEEKNLEVTDRKTIAYNYLSGWFLIDFFSIVPFE